jgi:hypothetical protein
MHETTFLYLTFHAFVRPRGEYSSSRFPSYPEFYRKQPISSYAPLFCPVFIVADAIRGA